jgi:serine/threonine protein phosphatase PrpC
MRTASAWRSGSATHPGLQRGRNEDRVHADDARGIYIVADGLGGHAAGEKAAETAVEAITRELDPEAGAVEEQVRRAVTLANNEICGLAGSNEQWRGMACVLTLAVLHGETVTVGHVGDSRLYLVWNGTVRKLTPDHSPVGEREDFGELTEAEAMVHPNRHEIYRDVGSRFRDPGDPDFAEVKSFPFHSSAALLLCSDGLSDCLTSADISGIVEQYGGDPAAVARALVDAANEQGGTDNISVVFIPGPEFVGVHAPAMAEARERHAITRMRGGTRTARRLSLRGLLWFVAGVLVGILIGVLVH